MSERDWGSDADATRYALSYPATPQGSERRRLSPSDFDEIDRAFAASFIPAYPVQPAESDRDRALSAIASIRRALDALEAAVKGRE